MTGRKAELQARTTYTSEMLPWAKTPAVHGFEKLPPMERYPELLTEFAQRQE